MELVPVFGFPPQLYIYEYVGVSVSISVEKTIEVK